MYARQITSEQTYTLKEARKIINKERVEKREVFLHKAKQLTQWKNYANFSLKIVHKRQKFFLMIFCKNQVGKCVFIGAIYAKKEKLYS